MSDIIKLLPDSIASQIAAGEVIQRPASVVKELLENSVDANADSITLVIKDSGKTLVQVNDNGSGMSDTDARMCFERHATSKISSVQDIFRITTKGFRGEALASIAAISQVEMITRDSFRDIGTRILIDGSFVKKHEQVQSENGTKISVKNLFYNIPARRKFLKTDAVEFKHITDEFVRIALAHPEINFSLFHNGNPVYQLAISNSKQRVVSILHKGIDSKIFSISEEMELFRVSGFIGNIDLLHKSRTNQYLFVNKRFIKSNYLNHAITSAYGDFNVHGENPLYVLFIEIDPSLIDINIHPTKQEIKFEEEKLIYNYLKVAVKHVIGKNLFVPKIEFDEDITFRNLRSGKEKEKSRAFSFESRINNPEVPSKKSQDWEKVYEIVKSKRENFSGLPDENFIVPDESKQKGQHGSSYNSVLVPTMIIQIFNKFLFYEQNQKLRVINIRAAIERINYDRIFDSIEKNKSGKQKQLIFPLTLKLDENQFVFNEEFISELVRVGFDCERVVNSLLIKSIPEFVEEESLRELIESSLENYITDIDFRYAFLDKFASKAVKINRRETGKLDDQEMVYLIKNLMNCKNSLISPRGDKIFYEMDEQQFVKLINS